MGSKSSYKCKLMPYEEEHVLSMQEAKQLAGWSITCFNLPKIWKMTQGEGIKVAVIDSGVDLTHPDLISNLLPGKNFVDTTKPPIDDCNHGTHVAGIICAENNDIGMVGVAPKSKVIPIKVLDSRGIGDLRNVAAGIRYAVEEGADILTLSLGSPKATPKVLSAIQYAESCGVATFCAAGNAGKTREIFYPAAYPNTLGIGSIDEKFNRSNFSCTGQDLDFLAPGSRIFSTVPTNWYSVMSGTSMANPFVVGVAALLLSHARKSNPNVKLSCNDYREIFKKHTISSSNPEYAGKKFFEGFGIIDPRTFQNWANRRFRLSK